MTIEEKLRAYILETHKSFQAFVNRVGLPYSTVSGMLQRGLGTASVDNVIKVCKVLNLSVDDLAEGRLVPCDQNTNSVKDILTRVRYEPLTLDSVPLSEAEQLILSTALEVAVGIVRRQRDA